MFVPISNSSEPSLSSNDMPGSETRNGLCYPGIINFLDDYLAAVVIAVIILMFYALALWDRWMNLKMKEHARIQRLETSKASLNNYGSTFHVPKVAGTVYTLERPPIAITDQSSSSQSIHFLAPPAPNSH
ncbi:hypothetical protein D9757_010092 [Collybiopsis confluens]|uniref:Uncharacterized protein n=1 Tax=Collybiopsis confluens TaxID=2823264 RepID=A0A8H5GM68_9AGAR|nr:hypothetical protein D9757_010092 [Collybiopsis confluens]